MSQNFTTTLSDEIITPTDAASLKATEFSIPAVVSTIIFTLGQIITSGGLLLIFILRRNTAKHASMIMISTLANILVSAIFDLTMRTALTIVREDKLGKTNPGLCIMMTVAPDFWFFAIILCLPLLSIERLLVLEARQRLNALQMRQLFGSMLVIAYTMALIVAILPTVGLFDSRFNTKCGEKLAYGSEFAYIYTALTGISILLTFIFSVAVIFRLKVKLSHLRTSMRKKIVLKQGTVSAISITGLLFLALVPFAVSLQLVLMCGSNEITGQQFCDKTLPNIVFRVCVILSRFCLVLLPIVFLALNPTLRRKIWLTLRRPKQMANIVTMTSTSMYASKDSGINDEPHQHHELERVDSNDGEFVTIDHDLKFGKSGDRTGSIARRQRSMRHKQSVIDLVDVLSVISERSEADSGAYSNSASDAGSIQSFSTLSRHNSARNSRRLHRTANLDSQL